MCPRLIHIVSLAAALGVLTQLAQVPWAAANGGSDLNILGSSTEKAAGFLRSQDKRHLGVFFNKCGRPEIEGKPPETYTLAVPLSSEHAFLILVVGHQNNRLVANVATLSVDRGAFLVQEAMGGEWTYQRLQEVVDRLRDKEFNFTYDYALPFARGPVPPCILGE